jgi:hypothetical protein
VEIMSCGLCNRIMSRRKGAKGGFPREIAGLEIMAGIRDQIAFRGSIERQIRGGLLHE